MSNDELCLKDHLPLLCGQEVACTRSLQFRWISFSNVCINAFSENKGISTNAFDWAFIHMYSAGYTFTADLARHMRSMTISLVC